MLCRCSNITLGGEWGRTGEFAGVSPASARHGAGPGRIGGASEADGSSHGQYTQDLQPSHQRLPCQVNIIHYHPGSDMKYNKLPGELLMKHLIWEDNG